MKKFSFTILIVILFSVSSAFAQGGTTGALTWNISGNTLTISGEGEMPNYDATTSVYAPWMVYMNNLNTIVIENGVTSIGDWAFTSTGCASGTCSITIPNSVTYIGNYAFYSYCKSISITIPNGVKSIGNEAFAHSSLISITILDGVTHIGEHAFFCCISLTSAILSNSVTHIGMGAFASCQSLTSIDLPNNITTIEDEVFWACVNLTSITLPSSITSIGMNAFLNCWNLTSITNFNPVPVEINPDVFENVNQSACTLQVPASAVSAYQSAAVWQDFNIVGFMIDPHLVDVSVNNEEYGSATGGGMYEKNEIATVTAVANSGYKFVNWTIDGAEVSKNNPYSFTVTEDVEVVANFAEGVGIVETDNYPSVRVYPNPTNGELQITSLLLSLSKYELQDANYHIFNVMGQLMMQGKLSGETTSINVESLASGMYFLRVVGKMVKFVKR